MEVTSWMHGVQSRVYPKLDRNLEVDVAIIGGGICGVVTAYLLSKAGVKVALFEAGTLGEGATVQTTALTTQYIDTDPSDLVKMYGFKNANLTWKSHAEAINVIEELVNMESIDCEFARCPSYVFAHTEKQIKSLTEEAKIIKKFGFEVDIGDSSELPWDNAGFLYLQNQAKFHPLEFLQTLAARAGLSGAQIFENTEINELILGNPHQFTTVDGRNISSKKVIICTYDPFNNPKEVSAKKGMYVSYVMEVHVPQGFLKEAIYQNINSPYNYFRVDPMNGYDRLIIGGSDHRGEIKIDKRKNFSDLEEYLRKILPNKKYEIKLKWVGPILEPSDGIALIGEFKPNTYLAAGFSGNGVTYSAIAARVFHDLIMGIKSDISKLYDPKRARKVSRYFRNGGIY